MKAKLINLIATFNLTSTMKTFLADLVAPENVFIMLSKSEKGINICGIDVANKAQMLKHCPDLLKEIEASQNLSYFVVQGDDFETPLLYIGPNSTLTSEEKADLFA